MRRPTMAVAAAGVVLALALAGCSTGPDVSGTPSQRLNGWIQGVGLTAANAKIGSELDQVDQAARTGNLGNLQAVCVQLQDDATIAHSQLPSPDQTLSDQLDTAYQSAYGLANNYLDHGLGPNRASGLANVVSQANTAQRALQSAQARVTQLTSGAAVSSAG